MGLLTLDDIIARTGELPSVPTVAFEVMRETDRSESNAASVATKLHRDQALTSRVLRLANSSFYGLSRRVSDASEAVVVLGMRTVRSLSVLAGAYPMLSLHKNCYGVEGNGLWEHSYAVATGAQILAARSRKAMDDAAFTAGLLHNIGKLMLAAWLEQKWVGMATLAADESKSFDELERQIVGFDHADVGAHLAETWNLPPDIVSAIRFHHRPSECADARCLVACVHVADFLAMSLGFGLGADSMLYRFDESALDLLGVPCGDLDQIADDMFMAMEGHTALLTEIAA